MNYLSEMLKLPVVDAAGEKIGIVNDLGIATGEVFPPRHGARIPGPGQNALHDQLAQVRRAFR